MGPLFGIGLAVWLTTYVCWPQLLTALLRLDSSQLWMGIIWWHLLIWLLLYIQFCLALNLSRADWQNIQSGIVSYIVFLAVLAVPPLFYCVEHANVMARFWTLYPVFSSGHVRF